MKFPPGLHLVFDFGGGTHDVALIQVSYPEGELPKFDVLGVDGDTLLGGRDIDQQLIFRVAERIKPLTEPMGWYVVLPVSHHKPDQATVKRCESFRKEVRNNKNICSVPL